MTLTNIISLSVAGAVLIAGLILLLVFLKKKSGLWKKILSACVAVTGLTLCILSGVRILNVYRLNAQQNFAACKLLEFKAYDSARDMAEQANERLANATSAQIITLSLGMAGDYDVCGQAADSYLEDYRGNGILTKTKSATAPAAHALATAPPQVDEYPEAVLQIFNTCQSELLTLLKEIRTSIKGANAVSAQNLAKAEALFAEDDEDIEKIEAAVGNLKRSAVLTMQLQAKLAAKKGDLTQAAALTNRVAQKDPTLSNKISAAVNSGAQNGFLPEDRRESVSIEEGKIERQINEAEQERANIEAQIDNEASDSKLARLEQLLKEILLRIENLRKQLASLAARRASNYLTSLWLRQPWMDRDTPAFALARAEMAYKANNPVKAQEFAETFFRQFAGKRNDPLFVELLKFSGAMNGESSDTSINPLAAIYFKLHRHLTDRVDNGFLDFLQGVWQSTRGSIHIGDVKTTDMSNFQANVSISREQKNGRAYSKSDFVLYDMGVKVQEFEVTTSEGVATSVCLVIDYSGSMNGSPLDSAKTAAVNFTRNVSPDVRIGLVGFDDSAARYADPTNSTNVVAHAVMNLSGGGGTNISGGLREGVHTLKSESGRSKVIVLLSDGEDGNAGEIEEVIALCRANDITVFTVGMGSANPDYLSNIANKTGGMYFQSSSERDLNALYQRINRFISNTYVFNFKTVSPSTALIRRLRVEMSDGYYDEVTYTIGPDADIVQEAINGAPLSDFFVQIGGSNKNAGGPVDE